MSKRQGYSKLSPYQRKQYPVEKLAYSCADASVLCVAISRSYFCLSVQTFATILHIAKVRQYGSMVTQSSTIFFCKWFCFGSSLVFPPMVRLGLVLYCPGTVLSWPSPDPVGSVARHRSHATTLLHDHVDVGLHDLGDLPDLRRTENQKLRIKMF